MLVAGDEIPEALFTRLIETGEVATQEGIGNEHGEGPISDPWGKFFPNQS